MMDLDAMRISDEEYVIQRAKKALKTDPFAAKSWMLTAKTMFPNNFNVQFEAYKIEKDAKHVKEAAKYFSDLLSKFQQEPQFWKEIDNVTNALRVESDGNAENQFLCKLFENLSSDVQHELLVLTADRCEDTMEHCKLLLLLLQKFPNAIATHGSRLIDTLLTAEKHSHASNQPVNSYRRLLICDLLPLLGQEVIKVDFSPKLMFKLLHKAIEFYLCLIDSSKNPELRIDDPWTKLFNVLELTGRYLGWESYLTLHNDNWTKEGYWQRILTYCQNHKVLTSEDPIVIKQLLYCLTIFFLHCLYDYNASLTPEACPGQIHTPLVLVEAFTDGTMTNTMESKSKRRKMDDNTSPIITIDKNEHKNIICNFTMAVNCWDLIHSSNQLQKEFTKLNGHIKNDLLRSFLIDYAIYKGRYDDALSKLQPDVKNTDVSKSIRLASIFYLKRNFGASFEQILTTVQNLPESNTGSLSTKLTIGGKQKHLHFLPITQLALLQYGIKILFRSIRENLPQLSPTTMDLGIGHLFVLMQLDWPQEEDMLMPLMEQIRQRGSFSYIWFQDYIINVDILEEFSYLWSEQGGHVTLDILPHLHLGQRRIGTRGSDKGAKEEIRLAIKRQILRCNESLIPLLINFIINERGHILQTMI